MPFDNTDGRSISSPDYQRGVYSGRFSAADLLEQSANAKPIEKRTEPIMIVPGSPYPKPADKPLVAKPQEVARTSETLRITPYPWDQLEARSRAWGEYTRYTSGVPGTRPGDKPVAASAKPVPGEKPVGTVPGGKPVDKPVAKPTDKPVLAKPPDGTRPGDKALPPAKPAEKPGDKPGAKPPDKPDEALWQNPWVQLGAAVAALAGGRQLWTWWNQKPGPADKPVESKPLDGKPADKVVESKPVEAKPADKVAEAKPADKVVESKPVEAKPADKVAEAKPADKVVESKPVEAKPADKVAEAKPADKVVESKPVEAKPADKVAEAKPADKVVESKPVEAKPADKVVESKPVEAKPADKVAEAKPADKVLESKPVEAKPADKVAEAKPADKVVESKPVESKPADKVAEAKPADKVVESKPVEAKPVETRMRPGESVRFAGESYRVAGFAGEQLILQRPSGSVESAVAEPITAAELDAKYEAVKVDINGAEQIRYMEKGQPAKGLFQITEAAGQRFIAPDASLTVAGAPSVERIVNGGSTGGMTPAAKPVEAKPVETPAAKPVERQAPAREVSSAPGAERLQGTTVVAQGDGTIRREGVTVGETVNVERLRNQTELSAEQIRAMEAEANRLKASEVVADKQKGEQLEQVVRTLRGEHGVEAQNAAHRGVLTEAKRELEIRAGRPGLGTAVGIGIIAVAAFAWILNSQNKPTAPLQRPRVSGNS